MTTSGEDEPDALLARALSLKDADEARALYRRWAASYDRTMLEGLGYETPARTAALLAAHLEDRAAPVLDAGAGTGLAGLALARHGFTCLDALDFSPDMLAVARSRGLYRHCLEADLTRPVPLPDAGYAGVIATGLFTHGHVGAGPIEELLRVLRPGGLLACTVHFGVWTEAGFAGAEARLIGEGRITVVTKTPGPFYRTGPDEGFYCLWRRLG